MVNSVTGVILAGGRSQRFGTNKAFALYKGKEFIKHVLEVMRDVFDEVVIVTNTPSEYESLGVKVLKDIEPYRGPLGGIITALRYRDAIFVSACDMPFISKDAILKILSASQGHDIAVAKTSDGIEPLFGVYKKGILAGLQNASRFGSGSVSKALGSVTLGSVTFAENVVYVDIDKKIASSINTVEEMNAAV